MRNTDENLLLATRAQLTSAIGSGRHEAAGALAATYAKQLTRFLDRMEHKRAARVGAVGKGTDDGLGQ